jgi:hypothetical protein
MLQGFLRLWFEQPGSLGVTFLARREKMKRGIFVLVVLLLIFVGCTRQGEQSAPGEAEKSAVQKEALEATKEVIPEEEAAQAKEDPDVTNCLQLVSQSKFNDALPVCLAALDKNPANEQVKAAVEKAKAAAADAAATAAESASDAQKAADEKVQGATGEATGGLP